MESNWRSLALEINVAEYFGYNPGVPYVLAARRTDLPDYVITNVQTSGPLLAVMVHSLPDTGVMDSIYYNVPRLVPTFPYGYPVVPDS